MYKYNTLEDINRKLKRMANTQIELKFARLEKTRSHTRKYAHAYDGWLAGCLYAYNTLNAPVVQNLKMLFQNMSKVAIISK